MKERKIPSRRMEKVFSEYLNGEENNPDNPVVYIKSENIKVEYYNFYLRFLGEHFKPCSECQDKLHRMLYDSSKFILGNNAYDPPVEFSKKFDLEDDSWYQIERRPATDEDKKRAKKGELDWWA